MGKKLKVAVIGTGLIATLKHLPALRNLKNSIETVAICDIDPDRAGEVAKEFGIDGVFTNLGELLEKTSPDIVDICTPPKTHAALAKQAIEGGAHILVEKPMCQTVEECDEVIALAEREEKQICVGHSDLFYPSFSKSREMVKAGAIGKFRGMRIHLSTPVDYITSKEDHWAHKLPGGVFGESGPHVVYMALAYMNPIQRVHIWGRKLLPEYPWSPFEDYRLELEGEEATCSVTMIYTSKHWAADVELWGEDGFIRIDLESQTLIHRTRKELRAISVGMSALGEAAQILTSGFGSAFDIVTKRYTQTHQELFKAFAKSIVEGTPSPVPADEGRESIRVMNLITDQLNEQLE